MSWSRDCPRLGFVLFPLLLAGRASTTPLPSASVPPGARSGLGGPAIPSPAEVLGFEVGADGKLASWSQIVDYFERLEGASPMIEVEEIGRTVEGRPLLLTVITAPSNMARIDEIRSNQARLADPRGTSQVELEALIEDQPAVAFIGAALHGNEIMGTQMSMELAYEMVTKIGRAHV